MATFETYTDRAGQYRFRLKADNGEIILASEGNTSTAARDTGIASVRTNAPLDERYERKQTTAGFSFDLKAANGLVIGTSEVYAEAQGRDWGVERVKVNAPDAGLVAV